MVIQKSFLFVCIFNMTLVAPGKLGMEVKLQYLFTLVRGELLHQFDSLYDDVEGTNPLTVEILFLSWLNTFFL